MHMGNPYPEEHPSLRVLLVPRLLARGASPQCAARLTGVPLALVGFIQETGPREVPAAPGPHRGRGSIEAHESAARGRRPIDRPPRDSRAAARLATTAVYTAAAVLTALWHLPLMLPAIAVAAFIASRR
jgi:hypothetical protein